jgi:signal transduction histidine kinase
VERTLEVDGAKAVVRVRDSGSGIPPEALPHVFDRFYRADKARSQAEGGAGLGLAIAKWIVESHRGSIRVDSYPGTGTTFTMEIPVR